jgi:serine protease Do
MRKSLAIVLACCFVFVGCTPKEISLVRHYKKSAVLIHLKGVQEGKTGWGTCSGVYVSSNLILTANHCTEPPEDVVFKEIWIRNLDGESAKATIVKKSPAKDLALLKTDLRGTPVRLAYDISVGETCYVIGNPLGFEWIVTKGIVSNIGLSGINLVESFMTDATILPGNSGGGVFNEKGRLIGIIVRGTSVLGMYGATGLGIAVDVNEVREFLKSK